MGDMPSGPVLVVEDDPSIRELLIEALSQEGLAAIPARDGEEAVRLAGEQRPSVVVLDMGLPVIDGAAVAARIREAYGMSVPFVVVTAGSRIDQSARDLRAVSYVGKPFDIDDLVGAVRSALGPPPAGAFADGPLGHVKCGHTRVGRAGGELR